MGNVRGYAQGGYVDNRVYDQRVVSSGGSRPTVNVSPNVAVGGAQVRVFIDGQEVRAIARSEIDSQRRFDREMERR
jgi:hypothetical protein